MSAANRRDRLVRLLEPVVTDAGFDLEDVVVTPGGKQRLLRVVIDADTGVGLDDIADVSEVVSAALDGAEAEVMGDGAYVLEVASPGVDRPLTQSRHWRRAVGRLVRVPAGDGTEVLGRVVSADDETVILDVEGGQHEYALAELGRGKVQVEFRRADGDKGEGGAPWT